MREEREKFALPEMRGDTYIDENMKRIWSVELDILEEFDRICKKYDLKYSLAGGSLIGAFRHGGFIPWDDDIDIDMVRDDYDRFLSVAPKELKEPLFLQTTLTDHGHVTNFARIRNSRTTCIDPHWTNMGFIFNSGIGIDIFPVDGVPAGKLRRMTTQWIVRIIQSMFFNAQIGVPRGWNGRIKKIIARCVCGLFGYHLLYSIREWSLRRNKMTECEKCGEFSYAISMRNSRLIWPTSCYDNYIDVQFEYLVVKAAAGYDIMNTQQYGDWRTPVKGGGDHVGLYFDPSKPYKESLVEKFGYDINKLGD